MQQLVKKFKGKEEVVMIDSPIKIKAKLKQLKASLRKGVVGQRVEFIVRDVETNEKFKKPPNKKHY